MSNTTKRAVVIEPGGAQYILDISSDEYRQLSDTVGGLIEAVPLGETMTMWCNEEGKISGLDLNLFATSLFAQHHGPTDLIVGSVIITGEDGSGDAVDLTDAQIEALRNIEMTTVIPVNLLLG
jgi:hypothetical protein